ncbi:TT viral ORF2 [Chlamydia trachomatis]|nr:TT viral ORF2 [Chlamydia trachomatis]
MGKALRVFALKMRFSRIYRTPKPKGALPLPPVPATPKKRSHSIMSWRPPVHDGAGIERQFFESTFRSHASCCGCGNFINHLTVLATRYGFTGGPAPPGGPGALPPLRRALPAPPAADPNPGEQWRGPGGGRDGADDRGADADAGGDYAPEDLDALFAAVAGDAEERE